MHYVHTHSASVKYIANSCEYHLKNIAKRLDFLHNTHAWENPTIGKSFHKNELL